MKLFGGSNGNNATFRLDDFTLNGYTQEVQVYAESYRRGFNGMEGDSEFKGQGNSYTTEFRQYDARVGRWLSLDPLMAKLPWQSPYCAMDNNPISLVDPLGSESEEKGGGDEPKQTIGTEKNPVEVKEVTICGNCGVKSAVDKIESGLEAPKVAAPKIGNKALENVDLSFFGDGFTTNEPQARPFDESTRTSYQKSLYKFSTTAGKVITYGSLAATSAAVLIYAAPVMPEVFGLSTKFWWAKGGISLISQASTNNGNINLIGVATDATLGYGSSSILSSGLNLNVNITNGESSFDYLGNGISTDQFAFQSSMGMLFGAKADLTTNGWHKNIGRGRPKNSTLLMKTVYNSTVYSFPTNAINRAYEE
jgi:RHS repeat-associated protein